MKILKKIGSRLFIVGFLIAIQLLWFLGFMGFLTEYSVAINLVLKAISVIAVLHLVSKHENPVNKLAWVIPILCFPLLGGLMYIILYESKPSKRLQRKFQLAEAKIKPFLYDNKEVREKIGQESKIVLSQVNYLSDTAGFPVYENTETKYYSSGESNFPELLKALQSAEHFIFMEYFIIEEGKMWNTILGILKEKAAKGVLVRVLYDDMGCLMTLPAHYDKELHKHGIECMAFNPFVPFLKVTMNHRNHRKLTVIDGHTAFTGGINLADEYINEINRYGYWKDAGIRLRGDAVWNLTAMFLTTWNAIMPSEDDFESYMPPKQKQYIAQGYVQPYGDSPLDEEKVGENVYLNMIHGALEYIYIFNPYLIIDNEMVTALTLAAKRGVDVRIITPSVSDSKMVYWLAESYYLELMEGGVKVYYYMPGFIHSKCFVCDDVVATVGSINMDFRSLYLHFENGVFLCHNDTVLEVKKDVLETLEVSRLLTKEELHRNWFLRLLRMILRLFAPLL